MTFKEYFLEMATYHASNRRIDIDSIDFNTPSLGFHVGTKGQAEYITKFKTDDRKRTIFKTMNEFPDVLSRSLDNKLRLEIINHDCAWEFPDMLLLQLLGDDLINDDQANSLVDKWKKEDESNFPEDEIDHNESFYSKHERELRKFIEIGFPTSFNGNQEYEYWHNTVDDPYWYKDTDKLTDIRNILISNGIGAIEYKNDVEQDYEKGNENSIVVFDKRMFESKDQENTEVDFYVKFLNLARKKGYRITETSIIIDGIGFSYNPDDEENTFLSFQIYQMTSNKVDISFKKFLNIVDTCGITIKINDINDFVKQLSMKYKKDTNVKTYTKDDAIKLLRSNGFDNNLTRKPR